MATRKGGGAPRGNKNASGPHTGTGNSTGVKTVKINRIVTYKTGFLGNFGIGKDHFAAGSADRKGNTSFYMATPKKRGKGIDFSPGLPANAKNIKIFKATKK